MNYNYNWAENRGRGRGVRGRSRPWRGHSSGPYRGPQFHQHNRGRGHNRGNYHQMPMSYDAKTTNHFQHGYSQNFNQNETSWTNPRNLTNVPPPNYGHQRPFLSPPRPFNSAYEPLPDLTLSLPPLPPPLPPESPPGGNTSVPPGFSSRTVSPLPGTEEYMQRELTEKCALVKRQLELDTSENVDTFSGGESYANNLNIINETKENDSITVESVASPRRTKKTPSIKTTQKTMNVEEIHDKIINHISSLSYSKKINLVNQTSTTAYDIAIQEVTRQKRMELSKVLRDMCNNKFKETSDSCRVINSIIPDFDIKIEELPRELVEQLSSTLNEDVEERVQASSIDPEILFQQAAEMLNTSLTVEEPICDKSEIGFDFSDFPKTDEQDFKKQEVLIDKQEPPIFPESKIVVYNPESPTSPEVPLDDLFVTPPRSTFAPDYSLILDQIEPQKVLFTTEDVPLKPFYDEPLQAFIDEPPKPFIDELPTPFIDEPPKPFINEPPKPFIHEPPKPFIDEPPKPFFDDPPKPFIDELPKPFIDEPPKPFIDEPPKPFIDEPPKPFFDEPIITTKINYKEDPCISNNGTELLAPAENVRQSPIECVKELPLPEEEDNPDSRISKQTENETKEPANDIETANNCNKTVSNENMSKSRSESIESSNSSIPRSGDSRHKDKRKNIKERRSNSRHRSSEKFDSYNHKSKYERSRYDLHQKSKRERNSDKYYDKYESSNYADSPRMSRYQFEKEDGRYLKRHHHDKGDYEDYRNDYYNSQKHSNSSDYYSRQESYEADEYESPHKNHKSKKSKKHKKHLAAKSSKESSKYFANVDEDSGPKTLKTPLKERLQLLCQTKNIEQKQDKADPVEEITIKSEPVSPNLNGGLPFVEIVVAKETTLVLTEQEAPIDNQRHCDDLDGKIFKQRPWKSPGEKKFMMEQQVNHSSPPTEDLETQSSFLNDQGLSNPELGFDRLLPAPTLKTAETQTVIETVEKSVDATINTEPKVEPPPKVPEKILATIGTQTEKDDRSRMSRWEKPKTKSVSVAMQTRPTVKTTVSQTDILRSRSVQLQVDICNHNIMKKSVEIQTERPLDKEVEKNPIKTETSNQTIQADCTLLKSKNRKSIIQRMFDLDKEVERLTKLRQSLYNKLSGDYDDLEESKNNLPATEVKPTQQLNPVSKAPPSTSKKHVKNKIETKRYSSNPKLKQEKSTPQASPSRISTPKQDSTTLKEVNKENSRCTTDKQPPLKIQIEKKSKDDSKNKSLKSSFKIKPLKISEPPKKILKPIKIKAIRSPVSKVENTPMEKPSDVPSTTDAVPESSSKHKRNTQPKKSAKKSKKSKEVEEKPETKPQSPKESNSSQKLQNEDETSQNKVPKEHEEKKEPEIEETKQEQLMAKTPVPKEFNKSEPPSDKPDLFESKKESSPFDDKNSVLLGFKTAKDLGTEVTCSDQDTEIKSFKEKSKKSKRTASSPPPDKHRRKRKDSTSSQTKKKRKCPFTASKPKNKKKKHRSPHRTIPLPVNRELNVNVLRYSLNELEKLRLQIQAKKVEVLAEPQNEETPPLIIETSSVKETEESRVDSDEILTPTAPSTPTPIDMDPPEDQLAEQAEISTAPDDKMQFSGYSGSILVVKVVGDDVLAASDKGKFFIFNLKDGALIHTYEIATLAITSIIIIKRNGKDVAYTGSLDCSLVLFDLDCKEVIDREKFVEPVQCMEYSWDCIFVGTDRGFLIKYNVNSSKVEPEIKISDSNVLMMKAAQEGPRRVLVVASRNAPVCVRDATSGLLLRTMESSFSPTVYTLLCYKNLIYCGTSQHDILVYTFEDGQLVFKHEATKSKGVVCMQIVKNLLFAGCYNGNVYVYNTKTNVHLGTMSGPGGLMLCMEIVDEKIIVGTKANNFTAWKIPQEYIDQMS